MYALTVPAHNNVCVQLQMNVTYVVKVLHKLTKIMLLINKHRKYSLTMPNHYLDPYFYAYVRTYVHCTATQNIIAFYAELIFWYGWYILTQSG